MTSHIGSLIPNKAVDLRHDAGKTVAYFTNLGVSTAHIGSTSAGPPSKHRWSSTVRRCVVFCLPSRLLYYYNRIHSWINKGVFPIFGPMCSCLCLISSLWHLQRSLGAPTWGPSPVSPLHKCIPTPPPPDCSELARTWGQNNWFLLSLVHTMVSQSRFMLNSHQFLVTFYAFYKLYWQQVCFIAEYILARYVWI